MKKLPPKKYFRTVIQIEVLSEHEPVEQGTPLGWIEESMHHGEYAGDVTIVSVEELNPHQVVKALLQHNVNPEFFELDSHGNRLDEWHEPTDESEI